MCSYRTCIQVEDGAAFDSIHSKTLTQIPLRQSIQDDIFCTAQTCQASCRQSWLLCICASYNGLRLVVIASRRVYRVTGQFIDISILNDEL